MTWDNWIPTLLALAWLLPLLGFSIEVFGGYWQKNRRSRTAAFLAVFCIGAGFVASSAALGLWLWGPPHGWTAIQEHAAALHHDDHAAHDGEHAHDDHAAHQHASPPSQGGAGGGEAEAHDSHARSTPPNPSLARGGEEAGVSGGEEAAEHHHGETWFLSGTFYTLARFGDLRIAIDYYIDTLTLAMFVMVTLIATCIHLFALGYMGEERTDDFVDHHAHTRDGKHLHRPGRFYRFFAYMSLFCFSMLGLVIAGNLFMVFVFWELVGVCSYLLIGFYIERKSASNAANKAFIMNRVGDFGFLIGLMVVLTYFGTFSFGTQTVADETRPGLFQMVRDAEGRMDVREDAAVGAVVHLQNTDREPIPYWLLIVAGLGVFAGCIGKSAQFPLQTWLPDAMEGPTPVSALVHSATMVAAGVYLAGRFYPMFTPEVLLVIAYVGCITLFLAATIAVVATDIKRVLAYSTISQLGYMMLAIGVAGWGAGLFHLITHAFFKSLMFLAAGSVIVACHHVQEMPRMGGLRRKMPITAYTMLVGVIAICGLALPGINLYDHAVAFSGYHSKDQILATSLAYTQLNPAHFVLFIVPLATAGITAFYMFRLWFLTFAGEPRDLHVYDHAHESPRVMTVPLIVLATLAAVCAIGGEGGPLYGTLAQSEPAAVAAPHVAAGMPLVVLPGHEHVHGAHAAAGFYALLVAFLGTFTAYVLYGARWLDAGEFKRQFAGLHGFLVEKWQFDNLYEWMFERPVHVVAAWCTWIDRAILDGLLHSASRLTVLVSGWDRMFDEAVIDGAVNRTGDVIFGIGRSFRTVQTGMLRQYVMFIAVGVLGLFVLVFTFFPK